MSASDDVLTPAEEATVRAIETDFERLFAHWLDQGFPRNIVVPMALVTAVDAAKRSGVSFERALETLRLIWFGRDPN